MKKLALAVSVLALVSGTALAADMPTKAPPLPAPVLSWAGFYIGGNGGYGWEDDPFSVTAFVNPLVTISGFQSRGWVAGGQVGYNWQYGAFVGGVELDLSATGIKGASAPGVFVTNAVTATQSLGDDIKLLGSARGRAGWAVNSDWLLYGTGGLAWERFDQTNAFAETLTAGGSLSSFASTPANFFGWVVGAGVEARIMQTNWIGRLEYLHYDFGHTTSSQTVVSTIINQSGFSNTVGSQTIDVVRAGLSYKFGN